MKNSTRNSVRNFIKEREWVQFRYPKDIVIVLIVGTVELLENYLWVSCENANKDRIKLELADVIVYYLLLSDKYGFVMDDIIGEKLSFNEAKFPVNKSKGNTNKYNRL